MSIASSPTLDGLPPAGARHARRAGRSLPLLRADARGGPGLAGPPSAPTVVNGYDECQAVLRDPRLGRGVGIEDTSAWTSSATPARRRGEFLDAGTAQHADGRPARPHPPAPPRVPLVHARVRSSGSGPAVHELVDALLDDLADSGDVEFMTEFALPLPMAVIGELVGVPGRRTGPACSPRCGRRPGDRAGAQPTRRSRPRSPRSATLGVPTSRPARAERRRRPRRPHERAGRGQRERRPADRRRDRSRPPSSSSRPASRRPRTCSATGCWPCSRHPEQLADWRAHPEIAPSAVEELLRFDSPVQFNLRTALEPADLPGEPLERGDRIVVLQGAANRDPRRFDHPEELDLRRVRQHAAELRLGHPPLHRCRRWRGMEGEIAFNALLARFASIELIGRRAAVAARLHPARAARASRCGSQRH